VHDGHRPDFAQRTIFSPSRRNSPGELGQQVGGLLVFEQHDQMAAVRAR
jgi:hypothetical protein